MLVWAGHTVRVFGMMQLISSSTRRVFMYFVQSTSMRMSYFLKSSINLLLLLWLVSIQYYIVTSLPPPPQPFYFLYYNKILTPRVPVSVSTRQRTSMYVRTRFTRNSHTPTQLALAIFFSTLLKLKLKKKSIDGKKECSYSQVTQKLPLSQYVSIQVERNFCESQPGWTDTVDGLPTTPPCFYPCQTPTLHCGGLSKWRLLIVQSSSLPPLRAQ